MSVRENDRLQFAILQFFKYVAIRSVENLVFVISWKNHVSTAPDNSTFDVAPALGLRWQGGDLKPAVLPGVACCTVITAARPRSVEWYLQVLRKWARHCFAFYKFEAFPTSFQGILGFAVLIGGSFSRALEWAISMSTSSSNHGEVVHGWDQWFAAKTLLPFDAWDTGYRGYGWIW